MPTNTCVSQAVREAVMEKSIRKSWSIPAYSAEFLRRDVIAGLTVATVAVPQAMAYALIAGIPPQYGLYTAIVMTALGSVFGSSRFLMNGPTNAISLVVLGAASIGAAGHDREHQVQLVFLLAVLAGMIQILIALLKFGDLTRYVSEAVVIGFMTGAGVLIALTQIDKLLGLQEMGNGGDYLLRRLWLTWSEGGPINPTALGIGLATLALIYCLHRLSARFKIKLPELLLTLILVSFVVWLFGLAPGGTVGHIEVERRLPGFHVPPLSLESIHQIWGGALAVALLGLVEALAIAKAIGVRTREPLDYNRQCLAEGIANLGGGLFQCMPGSGSLTRSAINYFSGAATRFSGIFAALAVTAAVLLFAPSAKYVPQPALAGVLMWTAWRIVDRHRLMFCLRATRFDAGLAIATALTAVFLSIEFSILIGTFLSFLFYVPRAARLRATELILSPERVVRERRPDDPPCGKLVILSLEGELFFGAAQDLDERFAELRRRVAEGARVIVLALKWARNPDMVCLEHLRHFLLDMQARKATVLLCGVRDDLAEPLRSLRSDDWLPPDCVFREDASSGSSTLQAVRRAYEILGDDLCATCPRRREVEKDRGDWYYVI
jgi:SulP family sulfate permease